jgi:hypothetical protein
MRPRAPLIHVNTMAALPAYMGGAGWARMIERAVRLI